MNTTDNRIRSWRRSTWVLAALIIFWLALFVAWFVVPDTNPDDASRLTALAVHFGIWAVGFSFSVVFWGIYRWFAIESRRT